MSVFGVILLSAVGLSFMIRAPEEEEDQGYGYDDPHWQPSREDFEATAMFFNNVTSSSGELYPEQKEAGMEWHKL